LLDVLTSLYYYRARFYDAVLERFVNRDPIGYSGGINLYEYVGDDPLTRTDPKGLCELPLPFDPGEWRIWPIRYPIVFHWPDCLNPRIPSWHWPWSSQEKKPRDNETCCKDAVRKGLAGSNLGDVICCDGRWVPCAYMHNWEFTRPTTLSEGIVKECLIVHEQCHIDNGDFPERPSCKFGETVREPNKPGKTETEMERPCYLKELECLRKNLSKCGNDQACIDNVKRRIGQLEWKLTHVYV
jgi:RHS repeat-associated protein